MIRCCSLCHNGWKSCADILEIPIEQRDWLKAGTDAVHSILRPLTLIDDRLMLLRRSCTRSCRSTGSGGGSMANAQGFWGWDPCDVVPVGRANRLKSSGSRGPLSVAMQLGPCLWLCSWAPVCG